MCVLLQWLYLALTQCSPIHCPSAASPLSSGLVAKRLTRDDIESLAFSAGHFRRGEGCVKLIRNVTSAIEQDGLLFKANCE